MIRPPGRGPAPAGVSGDRVGWPTTTARMSREYLSGTSGGCVLD
ncbi:Hypothetical protein CAP_1459 [Chondromyces apiculatus DSM 436]|uniref:Uncharacterized protein n=1 Tax=Chondromyces apiculatus DSM 436 TaxID=1192034 RepID=A0A017TCV4_9BACT|nr:Hypothetical protein CAP_1459 [Chondromyces apiculatus DSM 436]